MHPGETYCELLLEVVRDGRAFSFVDRDDSSLATREEGAESLADILELTCIARSEVTLRYQLGEHCEIQCYVGRRGGS